MINNWETYVEQLNQTCVELLYESKEAYKKYMGSNSVYATDFEISMFVILHNTKVIVYKYGDAGLVKCEEFVPPDEKSTNKEIKIFFTGGERGRHFEVSKSLDVETGGEMLLIEEKMWNKVYKLEVK